MVEKNGLVGAPIFMNTNHWTASCLFVNIEFDHSCEPISSHKFIRLPVSSESVVVTFRIPYYNTKCKIGQTVSLVTTNIPGKIDLKPDPALEWLTGELSFPDSGTFSYHIVSNGFESKGGTLQLPPRLRIKDGLLQLESITMISVVSKWIGRLESWPDTLKPLSDAGYNMIHFTPLQIRGMSNSPYSIFDHNRLSPDLFDPSESITDDAKMKILMRVIETLEQENRQLSMIDIVWNHISCDSPYLKDHPDLGYTLQNSPHLKIAYDLDEGILQFSREFDSLYGFDPHIKDEAELEMVMRVFLLDHIPKLALWEYFVINVGSHVAKLEERIKTLITGRRPSKEDSDGIKRSTNINSLADALANDGNHDRFSEYLVLDRVVEFYDQEINGIVKAASESDRSLRLSSLLSSYRTSIDAINYRKYRCYDEKIQKIMANLRSRIRYERLDHNGPRLGPVSEKSPLVSTYFTRIRNNDGELIVFANNGWLWNADPLINFAESSDAYFVRDVIIWGDCVKLRYGRSPEDSPWLWNYMKKYTELMASIFHAFRIDNCHSTPIHVAEYLLKVARIVRTELYVCAELFTGSADRDMEFITKLGLSSLIREAMVSGSPQELCHNASQYSGRIIGSFAPSYGDSRNESSLNVTQVPHALFADCTHDNETPFQRRCASDALPNTALVAMSVCGAASVIGYDQLFPYRIDIVGDQRIFGSFDCGILPVKKILNRVHVKMMEEGYTEFFADSSASNMITTIRSNPVTRASYLLLSCHAFVHDHVRKDLSLEFDYCHVDLVLFSCLRVDEDHRPTSKKYMEGFDSSLDLCVDRMDEKFGYFEKIGTKTKVFIRQMQPGSVVLLHRMPAKDCKDLLLSLDSSSLFNDLPKMITNMNLDHLNLLLYRCDKEERDSEYPGGAYDVPGFGPLAYCGLEGFYRICKELEKTNDIGHPFCQNLISGPWMMDYICNRMKPYVELAEFGKWLQSIFEMVKDLDAHLIPKYFCRIIIHLRNELASRGIVLLGVQNSSSLMQKLALVSIQMIGQVKSTGLYPKGMQRTMSAGLPHFTTHHMRVWGRDVFIAFKGMFLLLGRFEEAKEHLIAFAGCMYRGLIPNLLDSGRRPRYNARDTTWFFLQALQDYSSLVPNQKEHVLDWDIPMRFDGEEYVDFVDPNIYKKTQKMKDIVNAILQAHINGIEFTEWNAGKSLDHVMKPEGFVVKAGIDHQKGFVYGGSRFNCGTWMDKMGESELAKNAGIPATPRDGCAIELTSLLKSCLKWLIHLADDIYPYKVLKTVDGHTQSLTDLSNQIQKNFKTCFYIPLDSQSDPQYEIHDAYVTRRGIFKDTYGSDNPASDYQFRPNFISAMYYSPELFDKTEALLALENATKILLGPLGMSTLDPDDPNYRPYYNQAESDDFYTSKGFSYHNGPEWVWCLGHYLTVWIDLYQNRVSFEDLFCNVSEVIKRHAEQIENSKYSGLPELTNKDGEYCEASCQSQAWSSATIFEALHKLESLKMRC